MKTKSAFLNFIMRIFLTLLFI